MRNAHTLRVAAALAHGQGVLELHQGLVEAAESVQGHAQVVANRGLPGLRGRLRRGFDGGQRLLGPLQLVGRRGVDEGKHVDRIDRQAVEARGAGQLQCLAEGPASQRFGLGRLRRGRVGRRGLAAPEFERETHPRLGPGGLGLRLDRLQERLRLREILAQAEASRDLRLQDHGIVAAGRRQRSAKALLAEIGAAEIPEGCEVDGHGGCGEDKARNDGDGEVTQGHSDAAASARPIPPWRPRT